MYKTIPVIIILFLVLVYLIKTNEYFTEPELCKAVILSEDEYENIKDGSTKNWWNSDSIGSDKLKQTPTELVNLASKQGCPKNNNAYQEKANVNMSGDSVSKIVDENHQAKHSKEEYTKNEPINDTVKDSLGNTYKNSIGCAFKNLKDFYQYQVLKKNYINSRETTSKKKQTDPTLKKNPTIKALHIGTTKNEGLNKFIIEDKDTTEKKREKNVNFNHLFGTPHPVQQVTNWVVSDGIKDETDASLDTFGEEPDDITKKKYTLVCKECPISTIQTYEFDPNKIVAMNSLSQADKDKRKGKYFVEKGGTYKIPGTNKCALCSYQQGCFYPNEGRMNMFQTQSCTGGENRECKPCSTCTIGKEYVKSFCGEGGGVSDTVCETCKICEDDEYKVDGCNTNSSVKDTICSKKSDCLGYPETEDYKDPGKGRRTYEESAGYKGGFGGKDENNKELKKPYYGKDRQCKICDDCPEGYKPIDGGCIDKNSKSNTICQRTLNEKKILNRVIKCPPGKFYDKSKIREFITQKNNDMKTKDNTKRQQLKANPTFNIANINRAENYDDIPEITDFELQEKGCQECSICPEGFYKDPNDEGCYSSYDTKCIPHTKCKTDGSEKIKIAGTSISDVVCGPCQCPEGKIGTNPVCDGSLNVLGCRDNVSCSQAFAPGPSGSIPDIIAYSGSGPAKLFTYDKPGEYGDSTRPDRCKVCDKECPVGKFQIGGCDPDRSTNIVCKDHRVCDPETQIVIEPGTATTDTICKCIDGYEWDKDAFGQDDVNKKCIKIKGECWKNPCHENAVCYDNFTQGKYVGNYVCQCDHSQNWIETVDKGVGKNGCTKISDKHFHEVDRYDIHKLSPQQSSDYEDLLESKPDALNVMAHTHGLEGTGDEGGINGTFHSSLLGKHIHK